MGAAGFTLIEILLAAGLLIGGVCVVLFGMRFAMIHSEYLSQMQIARSAAQGLLERLSTTSFTTLQHCPTLLPPLPYQCTEGANGQMRRCALEDLDCDGTPNIAASTFVLPSGALIAQIKPAGELLDIHVAACWQHRGRQISELGKCDEVNTWGDTNNNTWVDSPVMVSTRIGPKD